MKMTPKDLAVAIAAAGLLTLASSALAQVQRVGYYAPSIDIRNARVVHWDATAGRAKETDGDGARGGTYVHDGNGARVLTYDTPITITYEASNQCGELATLRDDRTQAIYLDLDQRPRTGKTIIGTAGTRTWVDGCDAGLSEPYATDGADWPLQRQSMSISADVADLVAGTRLAGLSEEPVTYSADGQVNWFNLPQDTVNFTGLPGMAIFERSGYGHAAHLNQNNWVVIDLPSGPRAYRRMITDARNGREIWLMGDVQGNELKWVGQINMVKPAAGASFGSEEDVARVWRSSFRTSGLFGYKLFPDHTANRCSKAPDQPWYCFTTVSWSFEMDIVSITTVYPGSFTRLRTWEPLVRNGNKQWVFETEVYQNADGSTSPYIARRVNYYEDKGAAAPSR